MGMIHGHIQQVILVCWLYIHVASEQDLLPPPRNIYLNSTNLIHVLYWEPEPEVQGIVNYSVQIQGEYERFHRNGTWSDVEHCQNIRQTHCDVTEEVAASVLYSFRVQMMHGDRVSSWAEIETFFDRVTTLLTPPKISLQLSGLNLIAKIQDYGEHFQYFVHFWQKGKEENEESIKMERMTTSSFLDKTEAGAEYCAYAIALAVPIFRNSSKSNPVCITTPAPSNAGLVAGLLSSLGVVVTLLALAGWKAMRLMRYSCCPQVDTPDALKKPYTGQKMVYRNPSGQDEDEPKSSFELDGLIVSPKTCSDKDQIPR